MQAEFNGSIYTLVDKSMLLDMINNGEDLTYVVTSKINDMKYLFDLCKWNKQATSW